MATERTPSRALSDIVRQLFGRVFNLVLGVVVVAVIARLLGERGFGEWSSILVVAQIAAFLSDLGIDQVGVERAAADPEREEHWIGATVALRALVSIPATLISVVAVILVAEDDKMLVAGLIVSLTILLSGPNTVSTLLQLRLRNDLNVAVTTVLSLVWAAGAILVAILGGGLIGLALAFLVAELAATALQLFLALRRGKLSLLGSRELWRPLARVGFPLAIGGVLVLSYARIDQLLILEINGARDAGLYAAVYRILEQAGFFPLTVATTLLPMVAAAHPADPLRVRRFFQTAFDFLAMGSLPALGFACVASVQAVTFLFGSDFKDAAPALPILMGAFVVICFGYLSGNMVVVLKQQRRYMVNAAVGLVVNIGLNLILLPRYGFLAAAWVTLATEVAVVGLNWITVLREMRYRPRVGRLLRTVVATAAMCGVVLLVREAGGGLIVLALAAGVSYLPFLWALRALDLGELRDIRAGRIS
jgi:O-antigen/teichoic acid export membrane protein